MARDPTSCAVIQGFASVLRGSQGRQIRRGGNWAGKMRTLGRSGEVQYAMGPDLETGRKEPVISKQVKITLHLRST